MKSFFRLTVLIAVTAFVFSSCKHGNEAGKMIPKDAMFLIHVDTKSITDKLPWSDIKNSAWFAEMKKHVTEMHHLTTDEANKLFDNPDSSGVDLSKGVYYFVTKDASSNGQLVAEGSIKDADAFGRFYKTLDSSATIQKDGEFNSLTIKSKIAVVWNGSNFAAAFDLPDTKTARRYFDNTNDTANTVAPLIDPTIALTSYCKKLFSLKSDSSLSSNDRFDAMMKEPGEMHVWVNSEAIMKSSSPLGAGAIGMLKLDDLIKDAISTYTVSFDNGKIDITHKGYYGKQLEDLLKKYNGSGINMDMVKTIPSQNIAGFLSLSFKPEGLKELVKLIGVDGMVNMGLSQAGITFDDFIKAMKGDVMIAFTDFNVSKPDSLMPMSKPDFNILFSMSIGDKQSFQKILDAAKKMQGQMGAADTNVTFSQNDQVFAISNHQHFLNDYLAGKSNNKFDFTDKISGNSVGLFIDVHKILTAASASIKYDNKDDSTVMAESLKIWNNITSSGGDFKDDAMTGHAEINLMDANTNSLKQLNNYFNTIVPVIVAKEEKWKANSSWSDSTVTNLPPPPAAVDSVK